MEALERLRQLDAETVSRVLSELEHEVRSTKDRAHARNLSMRDSEWQMWGAIASSLQSLFGPDAERITISGAIRIVGKATYCILEMLGLLVKPQKGERS